MKYFINLYGFKHNACLSRSAVRLPALRTLSSLYLITLACALCVPGDSRADAGYGVPLNSGGAGGKGGVDGIGADVDGEDGPAGGGSTGGGGAVDISTGYGGFGGAGGFTGTANIYGERGQIGLVGLLVHSPAVITHHVTGGAGGAGANGVSGVSTPGGGGGGAPAIIADSAMTIASTVYITGGLGGGSGIGRSSGSGGGGAGIVTTADLLIEAGAFVTGGSSSTRLVTGGGGAMGVLMLDNAVLINHGTMTGGAGAGVNIGGGGDGGAGLWVTTAATIINQSGGQIIGGAGGKGQHHLASGRSAGKGGVGVKGENITLINAGTIAGSLSGIAGSVGGSVPQTQAAAVQFTGGVNSLELHASSVIDGTVLAFSQADRLKLGGSDNGSFDMGNLGAAQQYRGFTQIEKTGTSQWDLTGNSDDALIWYLNEGVLAASDSGHLGDEAGQLIFGGGILQITGTGLMATGHQIVVQDHHAHIDIDDSSHVFILSGVVSGAEGLRKTGAGTLIVTGDNDFSGGLMIEQGVVRAGSDRAFGDGTVQIDAGATAELTAFHLRQTGLSGAGTVDLGTGSLKLDLQMHGQFAGMLTGSGDLIKTGHGLFTLSGGNDYSGLTKIEGGGLRQGAAGALSAASSYLGLAGTSLDLSGFDTMMAALDHGGVLQLGQSAGTYLHITGNYHGDQGLVILHTVLGDDFSVTDSLRIDGDSSGHSFLKVVNQNGVGGKTNAGIKLVDVGGLSQGTFTLIGNTKTKTGEPAMIAGAYSYTLQHNDMAGNNDGNWYLRSILHNPAPPPQPNPYPPSDDEVVPHYHSGAPVYEAYAQNLQSLNRLPSLNERLGNRYWHGAGNPVIVQGSDALNEDYNAEQAGALAGASGLWTRLNTARSRLGAGTSTTQMQQDITVISVLAGLDGQLAETAGGQLIGGITGQYGNAVSTISSPHGDGKIDSDGWGFGGTLTWLSDQGFYLDAQAQAMWYRSDLTSAPAGVSLRDQNHSFGYAFSLEAGKPWALDAYWSATPQVQIMWSTLNFDSFDDIWLVPVGLPDHQSLNTRLGLQFDYNNAWHGRSGQLERLNFYTGIHWYQELLTAKAVNLAGVDFDAADDRSWGGVNIGGIYSWADDKFAIYGEGMLNSSLTHFSRNYNMKLAGGFKVKW